MDFLDLSRRLFFSDSLIWLCDEAILPSLILVGSARTSEPSAARAAGISVTRAIGAQLLYYTAPYRYTPCIHA
jgi:hypothetical protein